MGHARLSTFVRATTLAVVACVVLTGIAVCAAPTRAQALSPDSVGRRCLAADTTTRWKGVAEAWAAHKGEAVANDSLRQWLLSLERRDQALREVPDLLDSVRVPAFTRRMRAADSANAAALMAIVDVHGWPTRSMVGTDGASAAFLIAQHNANIQQTALARMLAVPRGEVNPSDLALLQDRVLVNAGKPQVYGTQLKASPDGKALVFDSIADPADVDRRRADAGLYPLSVYICVIRGMYGRDVIDPRTERKQASPR